MVANCNECGDREPRLFVQSMWCQGFFEWPCLNGTVPHGALISLNTKIDLMMSLTNFVTLG